MRITISFRLILAPVGRSRTMTVFALDSHRAISHLPLAQGADVIRFDPGLVRAYAACSSGVIAIYQEDDPDHFRKVKDFPVQKLVHSLAVDTGSSPNLCSGTRRKRNSHRPDDCVRTDPESLENERTANGLT